MPALSCPNCSETMERAALDGVYGPRIEIDICYGCHALWLDKRESLHLSPGGTLDLFRMLHEHEDDPRHALGRRIVCPHCDRRLSLRQDIGKGGRFSYYACPAEHGRLTPFSEFLKEKEFVRALTPLEQQRLSAEVRTVQCSGCGAPVDLTRGFQCDHCGAPLTVLDAEAVERTLRDLEAARARRSGDPEEKEMRARAMASMEAMRSYPDERFDPVDLRRMRPSGNLGIDLLTATIGALFRRY